MANISLNNRQPDNGRYYRGQLEYAIGVPFVDGNRLTILQNGVEIFPAMIDAIKRAQYSIDFETFVYWRGDIAERFADALASKAREGRVVRVLLDAYGAKRLAKHLVNKMEDAGVEVRWFRPLKTWRIWRVDKRTHRKIMVIDNATGFTGGVGIAEEWTGDARNPDEWRDTHLRMVGPAVRALKAAFLENWNEAGEWLWEESHDLSKPQGGGVPVQIVRAAATIGWNDMATLIRSLVSASTHSLSLVTAYFVPDPKLVDLICEAVERGVDVRMMIPGRYSDSILSQLAGQVSIDRLLEQGVKIWRYQKTMLHSKLVMVDNTLACVGSANLNHRSMGKDEECCAVILSPELTTQLEEQFSQDCENAQSLILSEWRARGALMRSKERLARFLVEQL